MTLWLEQTGSELIALPGEAAALPASQWHYHPTGGSQLLELARWQGEPAPALQMHFHDEAQLVFVLAGTRGFALPAATLTLHAGQCAYLPPGVPHRSLAQPYSPTVCINAYATAPAHDPGVTVIDIEARWLQAGAVPLDDVMRAVHRCSATPPAPEGAAARHDPWHERITGTQDALHELAARSGYTREGFSRRFSQAAGMPPRLSASASARCRARTPRPQQARRT
jgi:quercetin dioxygenase-like cupin family protein